MNTSAGCQRCFVAATDCPAAGSSESGGPQCTACYSCTAPAADCGCTVAEIMNAGDHAGLSTGCWSCVAATGVNADNLVATCNTAATCTGAACRCSSADHAINAGQPCAADGTTCVSANCMACYDFRPVADHGVCYTAAPTTPSPASGAGTVAPVLVLAATGAFLAL